MKASFDTSVWNCLDFSGVDFQLGGYWGAPFTNLIYLLVDSCNEEKTKCSSMDEIRSLFPGTENNLFYAMLYPTYYFTPDNITNPLNYNYYYFYQAVDLNIIKKNVFFFKDILCDDDTGWIFNSVEASKIFSFDYLINDFYFKSDKDYINPSKDTNTLIFMNALYFNKDPIYLKRSFMKFQDLIALVGGLVKALMVAFSFMANYYNYTGMNVDLINKFFYHKELKESADNSLKAEIVHTHFHGTSTFTLTSKTDQKFMFSNKLKAQDQQIKLNLPPVLSKEVNPIHNKKVKKERFTNVPLLFPFLYTKHKKMSHIKLAERVIKKRLGIEAYLRNSLIFEKVQSVLFSETQNNILNIIQPIDLDNNQNEIKLKEFLKKDEACLDQAINEYRISLSKEGGSHFDEKILKCLA
jgi:hypothetical protein